MHCYHCYHLNNKGQEVGGEEGEPADKEDNEDDDERLCSIDVISEGLVPIYNNSITSYKLSFVTRS